MSNSKSSSFYIKESPSQFFGRRNESRRTRKWFADMFIETSRQVRGDDRWNDEYYDDDYDDDDDDDDYNDDNLPMTEQKNSDSLPTNLECTPRF